MGQMFDNVKQFFEDGHWKYHCDKDDTIIHFGMTCRNGSFQCVAHAREDAEQFVVYSHFPCNAPAEYRDKVARYLTRANYGLVIGNFEMDLDDGEIRYKTSICVRDSNLDNGMIKHAVGFNVNMMDKYMPGLMAIIYADADPDEKVNEIEGKKMGFDELGLPPDLKSFFESDE